jgi:hypothetical protein
VVCASAVAGVQVVVARTPAAQRLGPQKAAKLAMVPPGQGTHE